MNGIVKSYLQVGNGTFFKPKVSELGCVSEENVNVIYDYE